MAVAAVSASMRMAAPVANRGRLPSVVRGDGSSLERSRRDRDARAGELEVASLAGRGRAGSVPGSGAAGGSVGWSGAAVIERSEWGFSLPVSSLSTTMRLEGLASPVAVVGVAPVVGSRRFACSAGV
jgi:hypothetical protein